jgi:cytochrome P450 family 109
VAVVDVTLGPIRWADWRDDPIPLYRFLRDEHPVYYDAPNNVYLVTRYADVDMVLKQHKRFSSTPLHMVDTERISPLREEDQPRHTFLRRIVMPLFAPREMRRLEPYFTGLAQELLDEAERSDVVEISSQLAVPLPGRVTCDILGVPLDEHRRFLELTAERLALLGVSDGRIAADPSLRSLEVIRDDLWSIVGPVVQSRRTTPEHDAITLLVQAQETHGRDEVSDQMIVDMLLHLLTGGFHTTQHLLESLLHLLADRPDLWQRMRDDRSLVPIAIEEMLRYDAPVQALRRRALEDVVLNDVEIPRDGSLAMVYGSANHDERVFSDPGTFSLDRDVTRHMAFSAGIHYCPGAPVSRFEVRALFDEMLDRYVSIERAGPSEHWPRRNVNVQVMHGYRSVPVRLIRADG